MNNELKTNVSFIYESSEAIKDKLARHPIDWLRGENGKEKAKQVDELELPPVMAPFFDHVKNTGEICTQQEFFEMFVERNRDWYSRRLTAQGRDCVRCRIMRNFYPAAVDSVYCFMLLCENNCNIGFDRINLDLQRDTTLKHDIAAWCYEREFLMNLKGPQTKNRIRWDEKKKHRPGYNDAVINIELPPLGRRENRPGNKMWFLLSDFESVIDAVRQHRQFARGELGLFQ
jgi:hypothetical protein